MPINRNSAVAAGLCVGVGVGAWSFYIRAFAGARGEDWMVYYTAVLAYFHGDLQALYDGPALTRLMNVQFASWLPHPLPLHPWLYPPHFLLLLLPFGLAPPLLSGALFLGASFAAMVAAVLCFFVAPRQRIAASFALALCPSTAITICIGQNTFLTCALLVGGFGLLPRSPLLGGALLGVLSFKPQLCLMVPVALMAARQWRALGAAAASATTLILGSAALFGLDLWRDWFHVMTAPSPLFVEWNKLARLNGQSVYAYAMQLNAGSQLADAFQAGAIALAGILVWLSHRSSLSPERKLALLLAATVLAAPHLLNYDALLISVAAILLLVRAVDQELGVSETILLVLVWLSPFCNPPSVWPIAYATVPLIFAFMAWTVWGPRSAADALQRIRRSSWASR